MTDKTEIPESEIAKTDQLHRECNVTAMKSKGFTRWINLKFAAFFGWAGDLAREINEDARRKDGTYHDEY